VSAEPSHAGPAVELRAVTAGYGTEVVLEGIDLRIERGELVGAVGPSGSGKTTLLRLLTGQADRHSGEVELLGQRIRAHRPARRVGYVPQLGEIEWDFPLTVEQVVLLGATETSARTPWFSRRERQRVRDLLERLGIAPLADRHIGELSGGQRQRMFLARAMARDVDIVLLDEPTSGVDLQTRHDVLHLLGQLNAAGMTILLTTHDLNWVAGHLPRVVCLNRRVLADGPPTTVFTPEVLRETYGAEVRILEHEDLVVVVDRGAVLPRTVAPAAATHHHREGRDHLHPLDTTEHLHPGDGEGAR
jgi:zinc/manganese transport system ATP-binding protein